MTKKALLLVYIAVGLCISLLMVTQLFWLRDSIVAKQEQFDQSISVALESVVSDLEKSETLFQIVNNLDAKHDYTFRNASSGIYSLQKEKSLLNVNITDSTNMSQRFDELTDPTSVSLLMNTLKAIDKKEQENNTKDLAAKRFNYKKVLVENIVEKIISIEVPIEQRLNRELVDSTIRVNLQKNGLKMRFDFAVRDQKGNTVMSSTNGELYGSIYSKQLFPNDAVSAPYFLVVSIPHRHSFVVRSIGSIILASIILWFLILGTFVYTIFIIVSQKKVAEIKADFVSNMTHELKTPIASITLAAEMLADEKVPETLKPGLIKTIGQQSKQLTFLVDRVLKMAMIEKRMLKYDYKPLDVHELIQSVAKGFDVQLMNRNAVLSMSLKATNPIIYADVTHFSIVIGNLIDNALKYTKENPIIRIETSNEDDQVVIKIKDNGIGISRDNYDRIFEQFYRAHTGNVHDVKGYGLGLNYVQSVVQQHNGKISVKSLLNNGSTFIVKLPVFNGSGEL